MLNSDLGSDNNAFLVFIKMLLMAHHEDDFTSVRFGGKQVYLKRGEFSATMAELSAHMNLPPSTIRKVINRLEIGERISKRTDHQISIYSICNFRKYQDVPTDKSTNERSNQRTNERSNVPDTKRSKEVKNNIVESEAKLLALLNEKTRRNFRVLPIGHKKLLDKFSLEEIAIALTRLGNDPWHKERLNGLPSDYLLRSSTIDRFLNTDGAGGDSFAERIAKMEAGL